MLDELVDWVIGVDTHKHTHTRACQVFCVGSSWLGGQIRPLSRSG
jgi:hypothetical protein